jgi:hypothetical protein
MSASASAQPASSGVPRRRKAAREPSSLPPPKRPTGISVDQCVTKTVTNPPSIQPLDTFARALRCDVPSSSPTPSPSDASARASSAVDLWSDVLMTPEERAMQHFRATQACPTALEIIHEARMRLTAPVAFLSQSIDDISTQRTAELLHERRVELPVFTVQHESMLLIQAGEHAIRGRTVAFPPCSNGSECMGSARSPTWLAGEPWRSAIEGLTEPITLAAAMPPDDLRSLVRTGRIPPGKWPCVLCHRQLVSSYVHAVRMLAVVHGPAPSTQLLLQDKKEVFQLWCNRVDESGGYRREYTLFPRPNEVVVGPLCQNNAWSLRASRIEGSNRWCIKQIGIEWKPPHQLQPDVGESLTHFQ